jgi:hypothetical protein
MANANDGTKYFVKRIAYVNQDDEFAVLNFRCANVAYLELDPLRRFCDGQTVLVIGSPEGLQGMFLRDWLQPFAKTQT